MVVKEPGMILEEVPGYLEGGYLAVLEETQR